MGHNIQVAWDVAHVKSAAENSEDMYIWIGDGVSPQILIDLFQVENWDEIGSRTVSKLG